MGCQKKSLPRRDYRKTLDPLPQSARDYPYPPKPPKPHFPGLEVVEQPVFRNYKHRYGAYPGYQDVAADPIWQDGSTQELARKLVTPTKNKAGRVGQTNFGIHDRVMGDLTFARNPNAKEAHEWVWYNIKDPNMFGLKPPRRWDHAGVQKPAPTPFYNRSDGHFLLNNSCTLVRLFLKPELRRLQCYFLPKLPKLIHPVCYHPPIPRVHRASTMWTRPEMWIPPEVPWNLSIAMHEPDIEKLHVYEFMKADKLNTRQHYKKNQERIEELRAWHRRPREKTPPPPIIRIDHHLRVRREELVGVRRVKPEWEAQILYFWIDELPDIMDIILAEEKARKEAEKAKKVKEEPPVEPPCVNLVFSSLKCKQPSLDAENCCFISHSRRIEHLYSEDYKV